jgi:hypothetical protein
VVVHAVCIHDAEGAVDCGETVHVGDVDDTDSIPVGDLSKQRRTMPVDQARGRVRYLYGRLHAAGNCTLGETYSG